MKLAARVLVVSLSVRALKSAAARIVLIVKVQVRSILLSGAFGTAVLYRKKSDDSRVVIKEINMLELSRPERQLALNEVSLSFSRN